jgi:hypothetical protein
LGRWEKARIVLKDYETGCKRGSLNIVLQVNFDSKLSFLDYNKLEERNSDSDSGPEYFSKKKRR